MSRPYDRERYIRTRDQTGDSYLQRHEQRREVEASYQHGVSPEQPSSDGEGVLGFGEQTSAWLGLTDFFLRQPQRSYGWTAK